MNETFLTIFSFCFVFFFLIPFLFLSFRFSVSFVVDGVTYKTAEHYMMAEKARLFNDHESLQRILEVFYFSFFPSFSLILSLPILWYPHRVTPPQRQRSWGEKSQIGTKRSGWPTALTLSRGEIITNSHKTLLSVTSSSKQATPS